jgi:hypothetical protein
MTVSFFEKYIYCAFTYSGIRKLYYTYNTQYKQKIDNKVEKRPILYSHHVIHFLFAGTMGIGLAPNHLINDIERMEMYIRDIKPFSKPYSKYYDDIDFYSVLLDNHKVE